jgi:hypothetical protein
MMTVHDELPPIELPPIDILPKLTRPAAAAYAACPSVESRAELIAAVDKVGGEWEQKIAGRAMAAHAQLAQACAWAAALADELGELHAVARWLRSFPLYSRWEAAPPYVIDVAGCRAIKVSDVLGAVSDACTVDPRLCRIARSAS